MNFCFTQLVTQTERYSCPYIAALTMTEKFNPNRHSNEKTRSRNEKVGDDYMNYILYLSTQSSSHKQGQNLIVPIQRPLHF